MKEKVQVRMEAGRRLCRNEESRHAAVHGDGIVQSLNENITCRVSAPNRGIATKRSRRSAEN